MVEQAILFPEYPLILRYRVSCQRPPRYTVVSRGNDVNLMVDHENAQLRCSTGLSLLTAAIRACLPERKVTHASRMLAPEHVSSLHAHTHILHDCYPPSASTNPKRSGRSCHTQSIKRYIFQPRNSQLGST